MTQERPNVRFVYSYRDFGNNKKIREVVFSNPNGLQINEIDDLIVKHLIKGEFGIEKEMNWFLAQEWGLDSLYFEDRDLELDHPYHTYEGVSLTEEECTQGLAINTFWESAKK